MHNIHILFKPVGVLHSEHVVPEKTPVQPVFAKNCEGTLEVFPDYAAGLKDIEGFSHLYLIYHLHRISKSRLTVKPFLQDVEHGIFATRAPTRPNPIGISIVELIKREGNTLHLAGVDMLDGTPILDIKPYSAKFDHIEAQRSGWMDEVDDATAQQRGKRGYAAQD
jgi:tRNA-Thr(GGU) m(6)t(6)A37 methyltransferase TsaA